MVSRRFATAIVALTVAAVATVAAAQAYRLGDTNHDNPVNVSAFKPTRTRRLVGGRVVPADAADTAAVFFAKVFTPDGFGFFCGASLLDPRHVLTRAGCRARVGDVVRVGGVGIFDGLERTVAAVTAHPNYTANGDLYDVAVLRLANPPTAAAVAAAGLVPVRLNGWAWDEAAAVKPTNFTVAGFGAIDAAGETRGSPVLRDGTQRLTPWATCAAVTDQVPIPLAIDAQVCTNMDAAASTALCANDMGGPLYIRYAYRGGAVFQLFGVASYWVAAEGGPLGRGGGLPNVYTRVEKVRSWVWGVQAAGWAA